MIVIEVGYPAAVAAYVADKEYKTANKPETLLSTNFFAENTKGVYTLTTDSNAVHLVDDVLADGTVMSLAQGDMSISMALWDGTTGEEVPVDSEPEATEDPVVEEPIVEESVVEESIPEEVAPQQ